MRSQIHVSEIVVQEVDLDELNHVNNVVYFSYLQTAALAHWYGTVPLEISDSLRWVVRKHEIEYFKPAFLNNILHVKTWIAGFSGVTSVRAYEIYHQEELLVRAQTQWVAIDPITLKPKRLNVAELEAYFQIHSSQE